MRTGGGGALPDVVGDDEGGVRGVENGLAGLAVRGEKQEMDGVAAVEVPDFVGFQPVEGREAGGGFDVEDGGRDGVADAAVTGREGGAVDGLAGALDLGEPAAFLRDRLHVEAGDETGGLGRRGGGAGVCRGQDEPGGGEGGQDGGCSTDWSGGG